MVKNNNKVHRNLRFFVVCLLAVGFSVFTLSNTVTQTARAEASDTAVYDRFLWDLFRNSEYIMKWTVPIKIYFKGEIKDEVLSKWKRAYADLSSISGINVSYTDNIRDANVVIVITDNIFEEQIVYKAVINKILKLSDADYNNEAHRIAKAGGSSVTILPAKNSFYLALAIVNKSIILSENQQDGLINWVAFSSFVNGASSNIVQPSVVNNSTALVKWSNIDIAIVKALYNNKIPYFDKKEDGIPKIAEMMRDSLSK